MTQQPVADLERAATGPGGLFYGVYPAVITYNHDPKRPGYVQIRLPMWGEDSDELWARVAVSMAGANRGTYFMPDIGDEVLVAFEGGNPHRPYVVGAMWNGQDTPPVPMSTDNNLKAIVSRTGIRITLDDSPGAVNLRLETPDGRIIVLDDGGNKIEISDEYDNQITMNAQGITVSSNALVTVNASTVKLDASLVNVEAGMAKFTGVVQCDTLIADSVIAAKYTPGAGNIW